MSQADAIRIKVGYPISPDTDDAASIARYYSLVSIDETKFFENVLSALSVLPYMCLADNADPPVGQVIK